MLSVAVSPLLKLPQEILDEILSEVSLHRDLLSFACVSKACFALAIPRHTEYRVIRVHVRHNGRPNMAAMWAHLARRADLTRNIREVHLGERHGHERVPSALIRQGSEDGKDVVKSMCRALRHMDRLRVFTWVCETLVFPGKHGEPAPVEEEIIATLVQCPNLRHLVLSGTFEAIPGRHNSIFPLWKVSNLAQLSLSGRVWYKPSLGPLIKLMLKACPTLETLRVPMEMTHVCDSVLPRLRTLKIVMESGGTASLDKSWLLFLDKNRTIEDLSWFPVGDLPGGIPRTTLPVLRRLHASDRVVRALYASSDSARQLDAIDTTLEPAALIALSGFDGASLREASFDVCTADVHASLLKLGERAPKLRVLSLPKTSLSVDAWMEVFKGMPKLEVLKGQALWDAVKGDMDHMHVAIMRMVGRCPVLRVLDHNRYDYKRGDFNKIVIIREQEVGHVRYEIRKASPRNPLTAMV